MHELFLNVDYETIMTEVTFLPSHEELVTVALNISITDDSALESTEQFEVFLNTTQEAVLIEREANSATVNIIDNDSKLRNNYYAIMVCNRHNRYRLY